MEKGAIPNEKFFFWKWIYWGARGMEEREDPSMIMYVYSLCTMLEKRKLSEDLHQVKKSIGKWDMVCVGRF